MKFKKQSKRKHKYNRCDADIITAKNMLDDRRNGKEMPLSYYDKMSDELCGKPSRNIYLGGTIYESL